MEYAGAAQGIRNKSKTAFHFDTLRSIAINKETNGDVSMCVAFSPEVIYKNVFYSNDGEMLASRLQKYDIISFCDILEEEIAKMAANNCIYKYVYFDFSKSSLSSFFQAYYGVFTEIGSDIFLNEDINPNEINKINSIYDKAVQKSLRDAKERFKECINSK